MGKCAAEEVMCRVPIAQKLEAVSVTIARAILFTSAKHEKLLRPAQLSARIFPCWFSEAHFDARTASGANHLPDFGLGFLFLFLLDSCSDRLLFICLLFEQTFVVFCLRCHVRELLLKTADLISLSHVLAIINSLLGRSSSRKSGLHLLCAYRPRFGRALTVAFQLGVFTE